MKFIVSLPSQLSYIFSNIKAFFLIRSFWGRTNFYNRYLQVIIIFLTLTIFITGIFSKLSVVIDQDTNALAGYSISNNGNIDTMYQGIGIQSITASAGVNFKVSEYTPTDADNLDSIAAKFGISKDTIKWANQSSIDYYTESFKSGTVLKIPELNGVLYEVQTGDTLDSVLAKTKGDKFQVTEINQLGPPNYSLPDKGIVFIPNGTLPAPVKPTQNYYYYVNPEVDYSSLAGIFFTNPMSGCGYSFSRGFTGQYTYGLHDGIDFSAAPGCPIKAAASGRVYYAGWANGGQGNMVAIDHGNGVYTLYYHASEIYVSVGQYVNAGDVISAVGDSGNAFGYHLHFSLRLGSYTFIDPAPYVPH
ncbi:MAG: M23 family metallopeptidase [Candidatus Dojkabacteria bacterium]